MNKLKPCPFCGREAKVKIYGHVVRTRRIDGEDPYFALTYRVGCFDCNATFEYVTEIEANEDGSIEVVADGYQYATDRWNGRVGE